MKFTLETLKHRKYATTATPLNHIEIFSLQEHILME